MSAALSQRKFDRLALAPMGIPGRLRGCVSALLLILGIAGGASAERHLLFG
jgi:hypothetical protein